MDIRTLLAFGSRYAVTMYERGCLLAGRRDPRWRGDVATLREVLGVPAKSYRDWGDIRARVVEPAIAEVGPLVLVADRIHRSQAIPVFSRRYARKS